MPLHHNLTSLYGGTGTLAMSGDGTQHTNTVVSIQSNKRSETVAMLREVIEYLGAGSYTRTDDDGLTLLMVQQQRDQATARAEKAEKERGEVAEALDTTLGRAIKAEQERDVLAERVRDFADSIREQQKMIDRLRGEQPRPLTPDAITPAMIGRAYDALVAEPGWTIGTRVEALDVLRRLLTAALTEPPARPEGAERFDPIVDAAIRGHSDITSPDVVRAISDALAGEGARAPEGSGR